MKSDLGLLVVKTVIVHEVPQHRTKDEGPKPILSEVESPLSPDVQGMLRDRIIGSAGSPKKGFDITWEPSTTSPVPGLVLSYFDDTTKTDFVAMSQKMAHHLFSTQPVISPSGLLVVMGCEVNGETAIAIMKIEKEEGARILQENYQGKKTFDIRHHRDLILTPKTKVFKIALFIQSGDNVEGRACDNQRSYTSYRELANYFLRGFLGCRMAEKPSVTTKKFYETTLEFLETKCRKDPEQHVKLYNHLVSELTSEKPTISPKSFGEEFLPVAFRSEYLKFLDERGFKATSFDRDITQLAPRLRKTIYAFELATLIVPSAEAQKRIKLENQKNGEVRVEFKDRLKKVRGK